MENKKIIRRNIISVLVERFDYEEGEIIYDEVVKINSEHTDWDGNKLELLSKDDLEYLKENLDGWCIKISSDGHHEHDGDNEDYYGWCIKISSDGHHEHDGDNEDYFITLSKGVDVYEYEESHNLCSGWRLGENVTFYLKEKQMDAIDALDKILKLENKREILKRLLHENSVNSISMSWVEKNILNK